MERIKPRRIETLIRWTRGRLARIVSENCSPARAALGFALGAFIGVFPSFLIGSPLAFFVAGRFGWNRAAAVAGTFLMNPVTAPLFYSISTWLGSRLLHGGEQVVPVEGFVENLRHYGPAFLVGNTVFALATAAVLGTVLFVYLRARRGWTAAPAEAPPSESA